LDRQSLQVTHPLPETNRYLQVMLSPHWYALTSRTCSHLTDMLHLTDNSESGCSHQLGG